MVDDVDTMPGNPVQAVTFNRVRSSNRVLLPQELPDWYASMQALPNPLRRAMHTLGLFSEALAPILDPSIAPVFGKQTNGKSSAAQDTPYWNDQYAVCTLFDAYRGEHSANEFPLALGGGLM